MDVLATLTVYIRENFLYQETEQLGADDPLLEGIIDSMGIIQITTFLESRFDIRVEDEELLPENFETMNSITAFVDRKRKQKAS